MIDSTIKKKSSSPLSFRRGAGGEVFKNIIIFSKTEWQEPPRLRHQLTRLLKKNGHNIIFFEKNSFRVQRGIPFIYFQPAARLEEGIHFYSHPELLHHQLRPFRLLRKLNEYYELRYINKILNNNNKPQLDKTEIQQGKHLTANIQHPTSNIQPDLIINFNYDYYFLKNIFPDTPIATIINDDFEVKAKLWMKRSARSQIRQTCMNSDIVLTVSYPLLKKMKKYNKNTYLFFPWAEHLYQKPQYNKKSSTPSIFSFPIKEVNSKQLPVGKLSTVNCQLSTDRIGCGPGGDTREIVLYYGYINNKLDWKIITNLAQAKIKLRFIGPVAKNVRKQIQNLLNFKNFELLPPTDIQNIDFSDVCCSVIPYDLGCNTTFMLQFLKNSFSPPPPSVPPLGRTMSGGHRASIAGGSGGLGLGGTSIHSITVSNRIFNLLSYGIPIVNADLKYLIDAPQNVIRKCSSLEEYMEAINFFKNNFFSVQASIKNFLKGHYEANRYQFLIKICKTTFMS